MLSWVSTIRFRLYLAFGFAASMTVVGSLFALYASADIEATLGENRIPQHAGDRRIAAARGGGEHPGRRRSAIDGCRGRKPKG
jgi:hypothetical protein